MLILKVLAWIAFIASLLWLYTDLDYEPAVAAVVSLSALVGLHVKDRRSQSTKQKQTATGSAMAIQAGGDVSIGNINSRQSSSGDDDK